MIQLRENGDFYRAGGRKHFVGVKKVLLSGREIKDGDAEDPVKIAVNPGDGRFQLLPQNLLFLLGRFFLRNLLRARRHWGAYRDGKQHKRENSSQHGDLRVSAIIRPNRRKGSKNPASEIPLRARG